MKDTLHIPKLNGTNYQEWKFQLSIIMKAKKCFEATQNDLSVANNAQGQPDPPQRDKDALAQMFVSVTCDQTRLKEILTCTSAHGMWTKLQTNHAKSTEINKHLLLQKFFRLEWNGKETVANNIAELESLVAQIKLAGENLSDAILVGKVVTTLPSQFGLIRAAWDNLPLDQQTLSNLSQRLQKEEDLSSSSSSSSQNSGAMMSTDKSKKKWCKYHKSSFHNTADCRAQKTTTSNTSSTPSSANTNRPSPANTSHTNRSANSTSMVSQTAQDSEDALLSFAFTNCHTEHSEDLWIADGGATEHMTGQRHYFTSLQPVPKGMWKVRLANGSAVYVAGIGEIKVTCSADHGEKQFSLTNVLYIPGFKHNLFSVSAVDEKGYEVRYGNKRCMVINLKNNQVVISGQKHEKLYSLSIKVNLPSSSANTATWDVNDAPISATGKLLQLWHERLGHISFDTLKLMLKTNIVTGHQSLRLTWRTPKTLSAKAAIWER